MIFKNAKFTFNGTNLSAYVSQINGDFGIESQDDTTMGDNARSSAPGLEANTFSVTFKDPWASSGPDATIFPNRGTVVAMVFQPVSTTIATTNPEYQFSGWTPGFKVGGAVGDEGEVSCEFNITTVITRDVTP
ncbi:MAG: hypothetical protein ABL993_05255 [Vicinamibacterales bacterium]